LQDPVNQIESLNNFGKLKKEGDWEETENVVLRGLDTVWRIAVNLVSQRLTFRKSFCMVRVVVDHVFGDLHLKLLFSHI